MRVYVAARYPRKDELKALVPLFSQNGFVVTSRWLDEDDSAAKTARFYRNTARIDLEDIDTADGIVFFAEEGPTPRGGRHVEFGYGLAKGKRLYVIGPKENVFHFIPGIKHYKSLEAFFEELSGTTH